VIKMRSTAFVLALGAISMLPACSNMFGDDHSRSTSVAPTPQPVANATVRQVQDKLKQQGYYKEGPVDGVWGPGTMTSVAAYQRNHNLTVSGQLDVPTLKSLDVADINNSATNPPISDATTDTRPIPPTNPAPTDGRYNTSPATGPNGSVAAPR
jgi:peptidoglycan hydrolase-like protein with peptidoglycan-binding domain